MSLRGVWRSVIDARPSVLVTAVLVFGTCAASLWLWGRVPVEDPVQRLASQIFSPLFTLAGLLIWRRRPGTVVGPALVVSGVHATLIDLGGSTFEPLLFTASMLTFKWSTPLFWLALLAFPGGRLTRPAKALLGLGVVFNVGLGSVTVFFIEPRDAGCQSCPTGVNLLLVREDISFALSYDLWYSRAYSVLLLWMLLILATRLVRARGPNRRVLLPVLIPATLDYVGNVTQRVLYTFDLDQGSYVADVYARSAGWVELGTGFWLPVGLVVGAYAEARRRERAANLAGRDAGTLEAGVRDALGDRSAVLLSSPPPTTTAGRRAVQLGADAWLECDEAAADDPRLLDAVAVTARLVLATRRRVDDLEHELAELRRSRVRLQSAADAGRRDVQRRLAGGPQARLSEAIAAVQEAERVAPDALVPAVRDVAAELRRTVQELTDLGAGLSPVLHGLGPALRALGADSVVVPDRRWAPRVEEAAYFVAAEGVANAAKHAGARRVTVTVHDDGRALHVVVTDDGHGGADAGGNGLSGLAERLSELGGSVHIISAVGEGTELSARVPLPVVASAP